MFDVRTVVAVSVTNHFIFMGHAKDIKFKIPDASRVDCVTGCNFFAFPQRKRGGSFQV